MHIERRLVLADDFNRPNVICLRPFRDIQREFAEKTLMQPHPFAVATLCCREDDELITLLFYEPDSSFRQFTKSAKKFAANLPSQ